VSVKEGDSFKGRIAFIIHHYSLDRSPTILNSAAILAENGYQVDIILAYETHRGIAREGEGVSITWVSHRPVGRLHRRWQARLYALLGLMSFVARLVAATRGRHYSFFIGVNPYGLMAATILGRLLRIPVTYLNLELTTLSANKRSLSHWFESWCNQQAVFTIVQDKERAKVVVEDNRIRTDSVVLVPCGARGPANPQKTDYLRRRFKLDSNTRIVLYAGGISNEEFRTLDLARSAVRALPEDWTLVIHGWSSDSGEMQELRELAAHGRIIVSTDIVPYDELDQLLRSADIGVALYRNLGPNQYLIGSASQKLAHYLKCGLPVITSDFPSLRSVVDNYRCGVCISERLTPQEISAAIDEIVSNYDDYVQRAIRCFSERYDFDCAFSPVIDRITSLLGTEAHAQGQHRHTIL